jgi:hypothetical protein
MPRGIHLTHEEKRLLVHHLGIPGYDTVDWLHDNLFFDPELSKDYLRQSIENINQMSDYDLY